jgi:hypothetical protein
MTITREQPTIIKFYGLSTDTLPPGPTLPVGSLFYAKDTGAWYVWDGAAWSLRLEGDLPNRAVALMPSAAQTTTQTSADQANPNGLMLQVILDLTVNAGGLGSITLTIQGKDPASGKYYTLLAGAAVTAVSTVVYRVGPSLTAAANAVANDFVPAVFRIVVTANNANPVTYSVGYNLGL